LQLGRGGGGGGRRDFAFYQVLWLLHIWTYLISCILLQFFLHVKVYAMNPILWEYMLKLENYNILKSNRTNVNKMAQRFVSQSITCEIISFAMYPRWQHLEICLCLCGQRFIHRHRWV
jgi:hypothetical protein